MSCNDPQSVVYARERGWVLITNNMSVAIWAQAPSDEFLSTSRRGGAIGVRALGDLS